MSMDIREATEIMREQSDQMSEIESDLLISNKIIQEQALKIAHLENEISDKDDELAKYSDMITVLQELLEAEKKADKLNDETGHDLAYDLWHGLRAATAKIQNIILPPLRVSITDRTNGLITTYHVAR